MTGPRNCPKCFSLISQQRLMLRPVVCNECGHVCTMAEKQVDADFNRQFHRNIMLLSGALVASFILLASWGKHSIEVISFRAMDLVGLTSNASWERMADICKQAKKYKCTLDMYGRLARQNKTYYAKLGHLQNSLHQYAEAAENYRRFFASGGQELDASYQYAKALAEIGKIDEASRYFNQVLAAKPKVIQLTVAQNYVKYLVRANRLPQARRVIENMRSRDETVSSIMDSEFKNIVESMRKKG